MNFRRIIMVASSHLRKSACTTVAAPATASVGIPHLWKRALAAPASASVKTSVTDLLATSDGSIRRIIMVVGSHLRKSACTTVAAPAAASVETPHLWKRALAAPASASVKTSVTAPSAVAGVKADLLATSDGTSASDEKAKVAAREQMFEKLRNLKVLGGTVKGTLNAFMKSEEEEKVSITQADLVHWAKRLDNEGKHKHACQIFEWMESKKMTFSPEELATYVELIDKTKGLRAAADYFKKVDPDFDIMDLDARNRPAYAKLWESNQKSLKNSRASYASLMDGME